MKGFILIVMAWISSGGKNNCDCPQMSVKDKAENAQLIFTGKVTRIDSTQVVPEKEDLKYEGNVDSLKSRVVFNYAASIAVEKVYKGKYITTRAVIFMGDSTSSCRYNFLIGQRYLVYASRSNIIFLREFNGKMMLARGVMFATDNCAGTTPETGNDEKLLKEILSQK